MTETMKVRPLTLDDSENLGEAITRGFAGPSDIYRNDGTDETIRRGFAFGVDHPQEGGDLGATSAAHDVRLSVPPGKLVRAHGLTGVSVRPDLTRKGLLKALMTAQFQAARDDGYAWSTLWATAPALYGRFGYGAAIPAVKCVQQAALPSTAREGYAFYMTDAERVDPERLRAIATRAAEEFPGITVMPTPAIAARLRGPLRVPHDREKQRCVIASRDGVDVGYSYFSRAWNGKSVTARTLVGVNAAAQRAVAAWLGALDFIETVTLYPTGFDSAALWGEHGFIMGDGQTHLNQWVKLLDVPQALRDRTYATDLDLTLHVRPAQADSGAEAMTLHLYGGARETVDVRPTDAEPDLTVDEASLAQMVFGAVRPAVATNMSGVTEHTRHAALTWARACLTDIAPTPSETF